MISESSAHAARRPNALIALFLVLSSAYPLVAGQGQFDIQTLDEVILRDASRNLELHVKIRFPKEGGPFPVVLFSHCLDEHKNWASALSAFWASHGYVTVHPSHDDAALSPSDTADGPHRVRVMENRSNRAKDLVLLLDAMAKPETLAASLRDKVDLTRVGVSGHSLGGHSAVLLGGATMPDKQGSRSFADKRVNAVLVIYPLELEKAGLNEASWSDMKLPMMVIAGQKPWQRWMFDQSRSGDKYQVAIEGAAYFALVDSKAAVNFPAQLAVAQRASLLFWDAYLKKDTKALEELRSPALQVENGAKSTLTRK